MQDETMTMASRQHKVESVCGPVQSSPIVSRQGGGAFTPGAMSSWGASLLSRYRFVPTHTRQVVSGLAFRAALRKAFALQPGAKRLPAGARAS